jgi:hypothetical protein
MPNHFHAIVVIAVGATLVVAPDVVARDGGRAGTSPAPTENATAGNAAAENTALGDVIGTFKSMTTHEYIVGVRKWGWLPFDRRVWQRNYWEHIIRTPESHARIADYIANNPARWLKDRLHAATPRRSSDQGL